jgi:MTH538 TIR-like domain (DUF1863)
VGWAGRSYWAKKGNEVMKRVFISFRAEDRAKINGVRLMAGNPTFDIEFYDESVRVAIDSTNADYIRRKIREKINRTTVTLCMVSELTHTSRWVSWELEESFEKGNSIICMGVPGHPNSLTLPEPARVRRLPWHVWDHVNLARLIEGA